MEDKISPPPQYDSAPGPSSPISPVHPSSYPQPRPRLRSKLSILDELIPLPVPSTHPTSAPPSCSPLLRRTGSLAVIAIFLLSIGFLACTQGGERAGQGLRTVFGVGSDAGIGGAGWVAQDLGEVSGQGGGMSGGKNGAIDFEKYVNLRSLSPSDVDISSTGKRLVFIGDVHGSYDPLQRLLKKLDFDHANHRLVHVGDLVAKGGKTDEVLEWMSENQIQGVRGNHDQPVLHWRTWMQSAGGEDWEAFMDSLAAGGDGGVFKALSSEGKMYPRGWEWKGEHWKIARYMSRKHYDYILSLPLVLHIPSLHTFVVHAGLLPHNPHKSLSDPTQPLIAASDSFIADVDTARMAEELSILLDVPQNADPWTLMNMRSVYTHGQKKGRVSKSAKKGSPWSELWKEEMKRCTGQGYWEDSADDEEGVGVVEELVDADEGDDDELQEQRDRGAEEELSKLKCSPVTVIYGHAAARGLDIKPFSKGIDTGCVYGRQLTALVLGDLRGLKGKSVRVGDRAGLLVSVDCGKGGI